VVPSRWWSLLISARICDPQLRVEVRERLVEQEDLRLAHDRAAERDALALPHPRVARLAIEERHRTPRVLAASSTRRSISSFGVLRSFSPNSMFSRTVMCG
jgi:hypothetical protein